MTVSETTKHIWENLDCKTNQQILDDLKSQLKIQPDDSSNYIMKKNIQKIREACRKCTKTICNSPFLAKFYTYGEEYTTIVYAPCRKYINTENGRKLQQKLLDAKAEYDELIGRI